MRSTIRLVTSLAVVAIVASVSTACSQHRPPRSAGACLNDQSPRRLENFGRDASFSVGRAPDGGGDAVLYTRLSDNHQFLLKRCGQHYHCHVENIQPKCGQEEVTAECGKPHPGDWVEIHTLYAEDMVTSDCDPEETPGCCRTRAEGDPILVMAYHAKVTSEGSPVNPIPLPWGIGTALWSGSTTGTKPPLDCKPEAQWNFMMGCDFTVSEKQLDLFHHIEQARRLQSQVSSDLVQKPPQ